MFAEVPRFRRKHGAGLHEGSKGDLEIPEIIYMCRNTVKWDFWGYLFVRCIVSIQNELLCVKRAGEETEKSEKLI